MSSEKKKQLAARSFPHVNEKALFPWNLQDLKDISLLPARAVRRL